MSIRGPDVSSYQGSTIDWKAVASAGASFAACKISEGSGYFDETSPKNWQGIKDAGLLRIAYHFARPDLNTRPEDEAQWFLRFLPPLQPTDIVALDLEVPTAGPGSLDWWALTWLGLVEQACGVGPIVYTGPWFARGLQRLNDPRLARYALWNAAYQQPPAPPAYTPWERVHLWQWTDSASYPSIGRCDESLFLAGTLDDLKKLGKPAPAPASQGAGGRGQGAAPTAAQPSTLPHYKVVTPTHFRPQPALDAVPLGPLLPAGTYVAELPAPPGLPMETPHWRYCRTGGNVQGYLFAPDLAVDAGHPGTPPRSAV
jgi:hypothetical protein